MKIVLILAATSAVVAQLSAATVDWSKLPPAATATGVTFDTDISPILKASCVRCHSGDRPKAQLRLDSLAGVLKGAKEGPVLTAGDSANSLLVKAVSQLDSEIAMPPKPRGPRGPHGPMGTNSPAMPPHDGGAMGGPTPGGPPPGAEGDHPPGGPQGTNGPSHFESRLRPLGPPPKPLTAEQVGLIRAWIDQGAK